MARGNSSHGIAFAEAIEIIRQQIKPIQRNENRTLADAHLCVLADDIVSSEDVPPFPSSAMDGYAVNLTDYDSFESFTVVGQSLAGHPFDGELKKGQALRVFTGSVLPAGTDAVVIQEVVEVTGERIFFPKPQRGDFVRKAGINLGRGDIVCPKGTLIDGRIMSQIAATGTTDVRVIAPLNAAIANTGDEIIEVGTPLKPGQIYNTNKWYLYGRTRECHQHIGAMVHIEDSLTATEEIIKRLAHDADIVIITGGASVGDADFVRTSLYNLGTVHFDKVASRPGKPLAFATIEDTPVFSLPGNPASVAVGFEQMVKPAFALLQGRQWPTPLRVGAIAECDLKKQRGRLEFQRGICRSDNDALYVRPLNSQDSAVGSSIAKANCFIVIESDIESVNAGESVEIEIYHGHF